LQPLIRFYYQALPKKNTNLTSKQGNGFFFKYYRVMIELLITFLYSSGHTRRRRRWGWWSPNCFTS
jgi:hypothetical protein